MRVKFSDKFLFKIESSQELLVKNEFFKNMLKYRKNTSNLIINLPEFTDFLCFRLIHSCITNKVLPLSKEFTVDFYYNLLRTMEYFCCLEFATVIESVLLKMLDPSNCESLYKIASEFSLSSLKEAAAREYLTKENSEVDMNWSDGRLTKQI